MREAARIQGFPDDFIFYGGLSDKQQMVSNAVPVQMSEAIAKVVKIHIETENNKQKELVYT
ncbi:Modification methylase HaeIII [compost metagenome]